MRSQDMVKLALCNFSLFVLNKIGEETYILKKMESNDFPSWEIIAKDVSYDAAMSIYKQNISEKETPLFCSSDLTTLDLKEISKRGFKIWRETNGETFDIEEFNPTNLRWTPVQSFGTIQERTVFTNIQLMDPRTIIVDCKTV